MTTPLEIDIEKDELILFSDVRSIGVLQHRPSYQQIYRYAKIGHKSRSGTRVFLGYVDTPTGYATSKNALLKFLYDINS
jgi:hypothetical protein